MAHKPTSAATDPDKVPVRLTPGEKTVRLSPGEPTGHVPGERTVRLEAAVKPNPEPTVSTTYDETILLRLPVIPGHPAPADLPQSPLVRSAVPPAKASAKVPTRGSAKVPARQANQQPAWPTNPAPQAPAHPANKRATRPSEVPPSPYREGVRLEFIVPPGKAGLSKATPPGVRDRDKPADPAGSRPEPAAQDQPGPAAKTEPPANPDAPQHPELAAKTETPANPDAPQHPEPAAKTETPANPDAPQHQQPAETAASTAKPAHDQPEPAAAPEKEVAPAATDKTGAADAPATPAQPDQQDESDAVGKRPEPDQPQPDQPQPGEAQPQPAEATAPAGAGVADQAKPDLPGAPSPVKATAQVPQAPAKAVAKVPPPAKATAQVPQAPAKGSAQVPAKPARNQPKPAGQAPVKPAGPQARPAAKASAPVTAKASAQVPPAKAPEKPARKVVAMPIREPEIRLPEPSAPAGSDTAVIKLPDKPVPRKVTGKAAPKALGKAKPKAPAKEQPQAKVEQAPIRQPDIRQPDIRQPDIRQPDIRQPEPAPQTGTETAVIQVPEKTGKTEKPAEVKTAASAPATAMPAPELTRPSLLDPPKPPRPLDALEPKEERRERPRPGGLGQAPWILALSSLGVVLVALAYAGGRYETPYAIAAYWVGQVVVFTPVVVRMLSRRLAGVAEGIVLVLGLALNQYLLKWFYSPDQFRFPDELQHWLATTIINDTGELFQPNNALPPAVHFPGLAEMGAGVSQLTGLSVFASGILVAGVAHLCFVAALFALVLRASGSPTIAGVSCVVYATTLHYLFFNSMYLYQTAALPFFMITIWAVRRWRAGAGWPFLAIAAVGIGLTTASHHVTAFTLVATLGLLGVTEFFVSRGWPWRAFIAPVVAVLVVAGWILLVARDVIPYLEAPVNRLLATASSLTTDHQDAGAVATDVSLWQLGVQGLGLVILLVLFLALARDTIARGERDPWRWSILAGTVVFFAGNGVRFLGSGGPEIAGRLSTFTYVPIAVVAAIALVQAPKLFPRKDAHGRRWLAVSPLPPARPSDRTFTVRLLAGAAVVTLLMIGARVGGWPPSAQVLPGPYLAAGFERSVDAYGIKSALYQRDTLGPDNRVGGDMVSISLASTYGRQNPVREVGELYYADMWTDAEAARVAGLQVGYLVVDSRLAEHLPTNGQYFEGDPRAGRITEPLTLGQVNKFDSLPLVSRLYDNGVVRIYQMGAPS